MSHRLRSRCRLAPNAVSGGSVANVTRRCSVVGSDCGRAVALVGGVHWGNWLVRGEMLVVCAETVSLGVWVCEHACLKHFIPLSNLLLLRKGQYLLGSGEEVMPGTMFDGEKAACSISAK